MSNAIEQKLIELIAQNADVKPEKLRVDMLVKDTGIDSLGTAELMFDIEEHYDITLGNAEALGERFELGTISELAEKLEKLIADS